MNLKIGGSNVGKIMYGGQEFGGSQMLESGTILLLLDDNTNWAKRRLGLDFSKLTEGNSITCKAFGVGKDWKNVSKIRVMVHEYGNPLAKIIDISELKNGPYDFYNGDITIKLEGNELTFTANYYEYTLILVEAYNE